MPPGLINSSLQPSPCWQQDLRSPIPSSPLQVMETSSPSSSPPRQTPPNPPISPFPPPAPPSTSTRSSPRLNPPSRSSPPSVPPWLPPGAGQQELGSSRARGEAAPAPPAPPPRSLRLVLGFVFACSSEVHVQGGSRRWVGWWARTGGAGGVLLFVGGVWSPSGAGDALRPVPGPEPPQAPDGDGWRGGVGRPLPPFLSVVL